MLATIVSEKTQVFVQQFAKADDRFGNELQNLREAARLDLEGMELPTRRTEDWKYTRVAGLVRESWSPSRQTFTGDLQSCQIADLDCYSVVLVNGFLAEDIGDWSLLQNKIQISSFVDQAPSDLGQIHVFPSVFSKINEASYTDGIFIKVSKGTVLDKPILFTHILQGEGVAAMPRMFVELEESSELELIFSCKTQDQNRVFLNELGAYRVGRNASLSVSRIQGIGQNGFQINSDNVVQEADSRVNFTTVTAGSNWVRNDLHIALEGKNTNTHLNGAYRLRENEHCDHHTIVDHKEPHCESNELYKGILYDKSTGVFNGKVYVREDAQLTNAFQQNANILMSDDATMNSKPELEIYADDVKCSHGSTTGQFDDDAVFYLQTRGLSEDTSRAMLEEAFLVAALAAVKQESLRKAMSGHLGLGE